MKGGGGRIRFPSKKDDGISPGLGAAGAGTALGAVSGASTPILTNCPPGDTSFMCQLSRFYNIVKMIIGLVVIFVLVIAVVWFIWNWWRSRKSAKGR